MTHQAPPPPALPGADPGRQVAQLRHALELVGRICGRDAGGTREQALEEAAQVSVAYDRALPIVQRRFDAFAGETAGWTAAGVEALLVAGEAAPPRAAADRLAGQIEQALAELKRLIG